MNYFIDSSDRRNVILKSKLIESGKQVFEYSQEKHLIKGGDVIVFSPAKRISTEEAIDMLNDTVVFSGNITEEIRRIFSAKNITHKNFVQNEEFAIKNANLTSEGVLALIISNSEKSLFDNKILIIGSGRIAKSLGILLSRIGAQFDFCTYRDNGFETYALYGKSRFLKNDLLRIMPNYDVIVNTIPLEFFDETLINSIRDESLFIETASTYAFKPSGDEKFKYILGSALPQKYSAYSAADIVFDTITKK